ncbi:MAG: YIP1 family protein [bacterium]
MESDSHPNPDITPAADLTAAPSSIWAIIAGVFTSPTEAFRQYQIKPKLIIPIIIIFIVTAVYGGLTAQYGAMTQYEMMKTSTVIPPQALEQMRQDAMNTGFLKGALITAAMIIVVTVLEALVVMFLGSVIMGGKAKFKAIWGVGLLGGLIFQIGNLLRLPLVFAKGTIQVSYGLAALFPDKNFTSIGYSLLYYLDIFAVWGIIVTGIGYAAVFGISRGKGISVAAIVSLLFIMLLLGLTAIGMSFAGVEITLF